MTEAATQDASPASDQLDAIDRSAEKATEASPPVEPAAPQYHYSVRPGPPSFVVVEETSGQVVTAQPLPSEHEAQLLAERWNRRQQSPGR